MRRLGSVAETIEELGLDDAAEVWDSVAAGELVARQGEVEANPGVWTIYLPEASS